MEFIRLNYLKFFIRLGLNLLGFGLFIIYETKPGDLPEDRLIGTITFLGAAFVFAIMYFCIGLYYFRKGNRLLAQITALQLFDGGTCQLGMMNTKCTTLFYTKPFLDARIQGYPVRIYFDGDYGWSAGSALVFDCCVMRFQQPHKESLRLKLNWKGQLKEDVPGSIESFIQGFKMVALPACQDLPGNL